MPPTADASATTVVEAYERAQRLLRTEWKAAAAERALRALLRRLERSPVPPDPAVTPHRVRLTLAMAVAERGHVEEGLSILDGLLSDAGDDLRPLVLSQRGLLNLRSGRLVASLADLDAGAAAWPHEDAELARLLLNRGVVQLLTGRLAAARADLTRSLALAERLDMPVHAARTRHNLGYLRWLEGDLPPALAEMDRAYAEQPDVGPSAAAVYRLDHSRVLFSAGLLDEAEADLAVASAALAEVGMRQDRAECDLSRAGIALTQDRPADAARLARSARREFERRGSRAWALSARLVELRALVEGGRRPGARVVDEVDALAGDLEAAGLGEDARTARLVACRARLRRGQVALARQGMPRIRSGDPIPLRLYGREVAAELARAEGRPRAARAARRVGLDELHRHQASFGSLDLQTAVTRHARALAAGGLAEAVSDGRAAGVLEWSERARSAASRLPPLRPPQDDEAARLLAELRYVRIEQRTRELAGHDDPALRARRLELERLVRSRAWYTPGAGDVEQPVGLDRLRGELAATRGGRSAFVAHLLVDDALAVLVVTGRTTRTVALGSARDVLEQVRRTRADLDALALRGVPGPLRRSMSASLARGLAALSARLWAPVAGLVGDDSVVLAPSGALVGVPWPLLAELSGRPVSVPRSATAWVRGRSRDADLRSAAFAGGPDLLHAQAEVERAATLWPGAHVLTGRHASVDAVLAALGSHDVVHVAAHGVHESENPLFSAVRLADGPLFGHDLDAVRVPARHVVLSACDLGLATRRPGDELLGMTAALLHAGTACVLASVARVADEVSAEVLVEYHRHLRAGRAPAHALALATQGRTDAPFVCFGVAS